MLSVHKLHIEASLDKGVSTYNKIIILLIRSNTSVQIPLKKLQVTADFDKINWME